MTKMDLGKISQSNHTPAIGFLKPAGDSGLPRPASRTYKPAAVRKLFRGVEHLADAPVNFILSALPAEIFRLLAPALELVSLRGEDFLFHEEDDLKFVYFPITAVVSEFRMLQDGRMVEVAVTGREGAIGLLTVMTGSHFAAHLTQVSQAGTAMRVSTDIFATMLRFHEQARISLWPALDLYVKQVSQKSVCNMFHSLRQRLCTWLLMAQDRSGRNTLSLTHDHMSRILGVYRPSVTCSAQELREEKLIDYARRGISIRNRKGVEESACACYFAPAWAHRGVRS